MKTLLLNDEETMRTSYLFNLSFHSGLSWFRSVLLYACPDDGYVSPESASLLINDKMVQDES